MYLLLRQIMCSSLPEPELTCGDARRRYISEDDTHGAGHDRELAVRRHDPQLCDRTSPPPVFMASFLSIVDTFVQESNWLAYRQQQPPVELPARFASTLARRWWLLGKSLVAAYLESCNHGRAEGQMFIADSFTEGRET